MNKKILIAEDDANFGLMLKIFLENHNFQVDLYQNGSQALEGLKERKFDLGILDIMMPEIDGFTLAGEIQKKYPDLSFIFLSAKSLKEDQLKGYQLGAQDYLVKPFDPEILLMKINILLQGPKVDEVQEIFQIANFKFDYPRRRLSLGEHSEKLSPKEAKLLRLLCLKEQSGQILRHEEALQKIWKNNDYFTKQSMNVFISKLRKYLSQDPKRRVEIENLHSQGFLLKISD